MPRLGSAGQGMRRQFVARIAPRFTDLKAADQDQWKSRLRVSSWPSHSLMSRNRSAITLPTPSA